MEKTTPTETTERPQEWKHNYYLEKVTGLEVLQNEDEGTVILGVSGGITVVRVSTVRLLALAERVFLRRNLNRLRLDLMDEQNGRCAICKNATPLQLDHIEPRSRGRNDRKENLRLLCVPCHAGRHGG
ncbi:hypothetical protein LCGC14_1998670 [marine sediment metagenome]|uniref:HNH nuclease domain-containing protein n=1 Tax=marine sediment metagenome TaxID=412755 RepID=A0A0F9F3P9_9ZZZZ